LARLREGSYCVLINRLSAIKVIKLPEAASIGALRARITRLECHRSAASEAGQLVLT